jgi:hypothetical protein
MNDAHLTAWTNEAVFGFDVHPVTNSSFRILEHVLSIVRMDQVSYCLQINGIFLRCQPIDATSFIRKYHAICLKIPYPVAEMSNALGFFEPRFAFLQVAP